jgi:hypothetical protein
MDRESRMIASYRTAGSCDLEGECHPEKWLSNLKAGRNASDEAWIRARGEWVLPRMGACEIRLERFHSAHEQFRHFF